ncbi:hypothetical protein T4B_4194 [Trichinella pseudospiralis]|uniref:Uncharacterized protein n=1 Tax=Trichinella pseudospiralis TaxID=6337 RepID=A0A0V1E463_TRIPS|nr:hypothetical protein T4A_13002 [Trichinella pseudospiralis]KRZ24398.1 hypothetical protein T4B_4194 [Trichinella pseudospiralis]KRZ42869.1 hypothetical protein T4C_13531 [Trichinella pseudospiralis]
MYEMFHAERDWLVWFNMKCNVEQCMKLRFLAISNVQHKRVAVRLLENECLFLKIKYLSLQMNCLKVTKLYVEILPSFCLHLLNMWLTDNCIGQIQ